jgi:glutaredoxin 3
VAEIEVYSSLMCPFCWRAKSLLKKKGVAFTDIGVDGKPDIRREMSERAGGNQMVPQIFIDGTAIGGSDELVALEMSGELDRLLGIES